MTIFKTYSKQSLDVLDKENQWSPHGGFSPSPIKNADISGVSPVRSFILFGLSFVVVLKLNLCMMYHTLLLSITY